MDYAEMKQKVGNAIALMNLLLDDMQMASKLVGKEIEDVKKSTAELDDRLVVARFQPSFRIMTRSTLAAVEGFCYTTKNIALDLCDRKGIQVSQDEREGILEKITNRNGKIVNHYLETKENIKLTFRILYRAFGLEFKITDHEGWKNFREAVDVRNRITHPKKLADMTISAVEYTDMSEAFEWIGRNLMAAKELLQTNKDLSRP